MGYTEKEIAEAITEEMANNIYQDTLDRLAHLHWVTLAPPIGTL